MTPVPPREPRTDPDRVLASVKQQEQRARGGRLKIFLGMAPGVGKTYAMLAAAHRMAAEGRDVVIGVAETHGRRETEQMLLGLDIVPRRVVEYRGVALTEFDLDAAMARRPEILVVDELAHTNAPGAGTRFEKRWQDVQELLDAGMDVFSTLNIQHVESLNDIVAQVTGVKVRETVPDAVIERADEIELVDLPPDALIDRAAHPQARPVAGSSGCGYGWCGRLGRAWCRRGLRRRGRRWRTLRADCGAARQQRSKRSDACEHVGPVLHLNAPSGERLNPAGTQ